jgi:hypothetical protein
MRSYRDLAEEFISTLRDEIVESQKQIEQIWTSGMRIGERLYGGSWSDSDGSGNSFTQGRYIEPRANNRSARSRT